MFRLLAGLAALVIAVGALGSASCKLWLNCHIGGGEPDAQPSPNADRASLPDGFAERTVGTGLVEPTDFAFLPDGRILITEQRGRIRVLDRTGSLHTVLDYRRQVAGGGSRGMVALAVDPEFRARAYVYVLYAMSPGGVRMRARLSRFTWRNHRLDPKSERPLIGAAPGAGSCRRLPASADCLPVDSQHVGAQIAFAADRTLFLSTGDGGGEGSGDEVEPISLRAQDVNGLGGKVLRITRAGEGLASNPFWNGDPRANRSKVWAYGFRNPFRLTLRPGSDLPYVTDNGHRQYEEINVVRRGINAGWPCYEGRVRALVYRDTSFCQARYRRDTVVTGPRLELERDESAVIVGGDFEQGGRFPSSYRGAYFFADWAYGWLDYLPREREAPSNAGPVRFAQGLPGPVALRFGLDGRLYYLSYSRGELRRIDYLG